jgi:hypothetical protein
MADGVDYHDDALLIIITRPQIMACMMLLPRRQVERLGGSRDSATVAQIYKSLIVFMANSWLHLPEILIASRAS